MSALAGLGVVPDAARTFKSARIAWTMIAAVDGWSVAPRSFRLRTPPGLVALALEGFSIPWGLDLLWRRDESDPTVRAVVNTFRSGGNSDTVG